MPSASTLLDLPYGAGAQPIEHGQPVPSYPFLSAGDRGTAVYTRRYWQRPANYRPGALGADKDLPPPFPEPGAIYDPQAYLIAESPPESGPTGLIRFTRTFARIPPLHYNPAGGLFSRPVLHDIVSGSTYAVSFDAGATSHLFASRKAASFSGEPPIPGTVENNTPGVLDGTTITVTSNNSTQTFQANASDATIRDAVSNSIVGNTTLANANSLPIVRNLGEFRMDAPANSIILKELISSSSSIEVSVGSGRALGVSQTGPIFVIRAANRLAESIRTIASSGHGGVAGDRVALWNEARLFGTATVISVTTDALTVELDVAPGKNDVVTHLQFAKNGTRIANGTVPPSARTAHRFYLPGVSPGITTMADVPNFTPVTDPVSWLATVIAYLAAPSPNTYAILETDALRRWLDGPILEKVVTEIQLADVIQTLAPAA
jgi:hypothetical protein